MKKIFIDCGAHDGCSVRKFMKEYDVDNEYEYHCFEMNGALFEFFDDLPPTVFKYNKAVSTRNGEALMLLQGNTGGSTINNNKKRTLIHKQHYRDECMLFDFDAVNKMGKIEEKQTECINLGKWIEDNFNDDDYIVLKMDIEGAEYDIITDMVPAGVFRKINELYIEFHMTQEYNVQAYIAIIEAANPDIKIDTSWDAMHHPYLKNRFCEEYYYKILKNKLNANFRNPLSKEEKVNAICKFANEYLPINVDDDSKIKLDNHSDFLQFRHALDKYNKVEEWKGFISKIAIGDILL